MKKENIAFEKVLVKTIDAKLKQVFGAKGTSIIYDYLQNAHSLRKEDFPERLETFTEGLSRFLSSGAQTIERLVLESLYSEIGEQFQPKKDYSFTEHVKELRKTNNTSN